MEETKKEKMKERKIIKPLAITLVVVVVIAVFALCMAKTSYDVNSSIAKKNLDSLLNKESVTVSLTHNTGLESRKYVTSLKNDGGQTKQVLYSEENVGSDGVKFVTFVNDEKTSYQIYDNTIEKREEEFERMNVIETLESLLQTSTLYKKGHEKINGENVYFETFPENMVTLYYDGESNLKFVKLDDVMFVEGEEGYMFEVEIEDTFLENFEKELFEKYELENP